MADPMATERLDLKREWLPWSRWGAMPLARLATNGALQLNRPSVSQVLSVDHYRSWSFDREFDIPVMVALGLSSPRILTVRLVTRDDWHGERLVRLTPHRPSLSWFSCSALRLCSQYGIPVDRMRELVAEDDAADLSSRGMPGRKSKWVRRSAGVKLAVPPMYFANPDTKPNVLVLELPERFAAQHWEPDSEPDDPESPHD